MSIDINNTNAGKLTLNSPISGTTVLTFPSTAGTSGQALTTDGAGNLSFATVGGGGGLTGFTAAESTAAPNATVFVDALTASAASTNADVALVAKGTGATLAQVPDNSTTGGNKRGTNATDWQKFRISATEVASGNSSTISGGIMNSATGNAATVGGGAVHNASGANSTIAGGYQHTASGNYSVIAGGYGGTASANASAICGGESNTASGQYSFVGGGFTNKAQSGNYNSVVGGANNIASGQFSFVGGGGDHITATNRNTASATASAVVGGQANFASGQYSFVGSGQINTASGSWSAIVGGNSSSAGGVSSGVFAGENNNITASQAVIVGGSYNTANANSSIILGGLRGSTRSINGYTVLPASGAPITASLGVAQSAILVLGVQTTDATVTVLRSNTNPANTGNQVILPNNSAYYVKGSIIATVTGGGNTKSWDFIATIKRGANAASTAIVGTVALNVQAADAGAATWVVAITADTTNGGLAVTVTGQAATTIRWVAKLETTEVTY